MNAITVNYAEVGDDHLPKSFGFVRNSDLDNQTVYNSNITEITGTNYSILQSQDIGTKDIIVSSDPKSSRLLSTFTPGPTSWINHRLPDSDLTVYIFYKDDGYYYKMVEDENGRPVQAKYAPYAYLTNVKDNAGIQPYCEATIETPVPLQVSAGSVKAVIDNTPVEIASVSSSLSLQLENANDDNFTSRSVTESEYTISSDFNLENIEWTRDGQKVTSWLLDNNKIVKSFISISSDGRAKTVKLLAGNNVVTIPRNKSTITVNFTFTNTAMSSFEWGGAYYNGLENSTMSNNTLTIKNVRQGSSINLATFYTDSKEDWFNPPSINPSSGSNTFNVSIEIPIPSATDTIKFTGWIDGKLEQGKSIPCSHGILPQAYTIDKMNTEVRTVDITNENPTAINGLLTYDRTSKQLKRHRQITQINKSNTGTRTTTIDDSRNPGTTSTDIYLYASNNNVSQTFNVTAKYNDIPYIVNGDNNTQGAINQVVSFKNTNYVYNDGMKQLVKNLTNINVTSLNGSKEITYYDPSRPVNVQFPDITFSITVPSEGEVSSSSSTETTEEYTATINCTVTNFAVTQRNYAIKQNNTIINASLIYNIECKANDETSFTCTVTITKITIQNKEYTINNATGSQTKDVQTVTKQLFN